MPVQLTLIDAHVHVYPKFDVAALLDSAYVNFRQHAEVSFAHMGPWQGVLLLCETGSCDWFTAVLSGLPAGRVKGWEFRAPAEDDTTLIARSAAGVEFCIVAGRQVVTREGVEVLLLATRARVDDGASLPDTLRAGLDCGAIVVLPWGFGKWFGKRGAYVRNAVSEFKGRVFVGDNSGRLAWWPRPQVFIDCERRGQSILPGTDPLPIRGEERRVGSCGFAVEGVLPASRTGAALRSLITGSSGLPLRPFGQGERLSRLVINQVMLRVG